MSYKIGETNKNSKGSRMTIISCLKNSKVEVIFDSGLRKICHYSDFKRGYVRDKLYESVCGTGFVGQGIYNVSENGIKTKEYLRWKDMLMRCYCEKYKNKNPTYSGCSVVPEWHNFQNFAKWYSENYYSVPDSKMELDKDVLSPGNKIYSPETCCFLPSEINKLFSKNVIRNNCSENLYIYRNGKYRISCSNNKKLKHLGYFNTREEAIASYERFKDEIIKSTIEKYSIFLPENIKNALLNFKNRNMIKGDGDRR